MPNFVGGGLGYVLAIAIAVYCKLLLLRPAQAQTGFDRKVAVSGMGGLLGAGILASLPWLLAAPFPGFSRDMPVVLCTAVAVVGVVLLLNCVVVLMKTCLRQARQPEPNGATFSHGLAVAPVFMSAALVLALLAGVALRWQQQRDVTAMLRPGGGYDPMREMEMSRYDGLRKQMEQILASSSDGQWPVP
jgi:hypothetical protein